MKKRSKLKLLLLSATSICLGSIITASVITGNARPPQEQITLSEPLIKLDNNEVSEFFWYGCHHCYRAKPIVESWEKSIEGTPVTFTMRHSQLSESWMTQALFFYTVKEMGILNEVHDDFFELSQKKSYISALDIEKFLTGKGFDYDHYLTVRNSEAVRNEMAINKQFEKSLNTQGVPSFTSGNNPIDTDAMRSWSDLPAILDAATKKQAN